MVYRNFSRGITLASVLLCVFSSFGAVQGEPLSAQLARHWADDHRLIAVQLAQRAALDPTRGQIADRLVKYPKDYHACILPGDSTPTDVALRRTRALIDDIRDLAGVPSLDALNAELAVLEAAPPHDTTMSQFVKVCSLRRRIALQNPLLNFDRLVFCVFNPSEWIIQGAFTANSSRVGPGCGLYMVMNCRSDSARIIDALETPVVQDGPHDRYTGERLSNQNPKWGGNAQFYCPAVTYDGAQVVFSWAAKGTPGDGDGSLSRGTPDEQFHLFRMNVDGSNLVQLTDHEWANDYHPCFLPNDRIVFISERLDRQERCGGWRMGGNLFSMAPDGSDLFPLSWHETNEMFPSVDNSGMIVYTRWDYVDRGFATGQHFWICNPDGRDPRAPHGNYGGGPAGEESFQAIPGTSSLYSFVETGHHGEPCAP